MKTASIGLYLIISLITTVSWGQVVLNDSQAERGVQLLEERKHLIGQDSLKDSIIADLRIALDECRVQSAEFRASADNFRVSAESWRTAFDVATDRADKNLEAYRKEVRKSRLTPWLVAGGFVIGVIVGVSVR